MPKNHSLDYFFQETEKNKPLVAQTPEDNAGYYGRSAFATQDDVRFKKLFKHQNNSNGVYLGNYLDPYSAASGDIRSMEWQGRSLGLASELSYTDENNVITFAPSGSGKGSAAIIPTLLTCNDSMFVLDVKGENWFVSLPARQAMGHDVVLLNPFNVWAEELGFDGFMTRRFNPLHSLNPRSINFVAQIDSIVASILVHDANDKEKHWIDRARTLLACLIADICSDAQECELGHNTLPYIHSLLSLDNTSLARLLGAIHELSPSQYARHNAAAFLEKHQLAEGGGHTYTITREVGSIRSAALGQLGFLNHGGIAHFLSGHDFSFADLRKKPTTIFCIMPPDELDTYYRFARLMVQTCFKELSKTPRHEDRRVLVLLDEQAKLRHMEIIETSVALLRGYKVRVWSIFQDCNQLKSIYGDAWETFISNSGVMQVMSPNDTVTAKYFSDRIGNRTITEDRVTVSKPNVPVYAANPNGGTSVQENSFGQPLLSPQSLYDMPRDRAMLLALGMSRPILTTREDYFRQTQSSGQSLEFKGMPYAPHPVHDQGAFEWMRGYVSRNNYTPLNLCP